MTRNLRVVTYHPLPKVGDVLQALTAVIDPELGIDVLGLGLVYGIVMRAGEVTVTMTLTTPGCPLHASIEADLRRRLTSVPRVTSVDVRMVWEPPWTPMSLTRSAQRRLAGY